MPDATPQARAILLDGQLRNLFRVVPWYAASNLYTGGGLLYAMWPWVRSRGWLPWLLGCVLVHLAWGAHAIWCLQRTRRRGEPAPLSMRDMYWSAAWCALCAMSCGMGIYLGAPLAGDEGSRLLLSAYTPGLIATGVLVCITTPLLSFTWLIVLTAWACLMVAQLDYLAQWMTIFELCCYAFMLTLALLFASRLFVRRVEAEQMAEQQRQIVGLLLRDFEANANDWLWESDREGKLVRIGARFAELFGHTQATLTGKPLGGLFSPLRLLSVGSDHDVGVAALRRRMAGGDAFRGVVLEAAVAGQPRSWSVSAKPLHSQEGEWIGWRGVGCDVSDARARETEALLRERHLHLLAHQDPLTGLPNRRSFLDSATHTSRIARRAIAMIDLDNFKTVNDSLGHAAGDDLLRKVAQRLREACLPDDVLARIGGDEFAVLLRNLPDAGGAREVERELERRMGGVLEALRQPERSGDFLVDVRASIGVSCAESDVDIGELLRQADVALYVAKNEGRDTMRLYAPCMSERVHARLSLVSDMSQAVAHGQFELHYMSLRDAGSLAVRGYEALLRWRHPRHGWMSPADFVPAAESSGLIVPIGAWVLEQACRDALSWRSDVTVSVNVSPVQLASSAFFDVVADILRRTGLPPSRLELEITETALARDAAQARSLLQRLRAAGMRTAIDDFGVGYSSMAQLRELPFDRIKLDQSFAAALLREPKGGITHSIVSSVVQLADTMHLEVTAEGVEQQSQLAILRALGCGSVQGYLFGRPSALDALEG